MFGQLEFLLEENDDQYYFPRDFFKRHEITTQFISLLVEFLYLKLLRFIYLGVALNGRVF
jgi:hypothetical protein